MLIDSRQVILEIKKHPCLYDQSCEEFNNRAMKMNAWVDVTKSILGDKCNGMDEDAFSQVCQDVQKRWRHLRDSYVKAGKQKKNRPYIFTKELSFLKIEQLSNKRKKDKTVEPKPPEDSADTQNQKVEVQSSASSGLPPDTRNAMFLTARYGRKPGGITEFEKMLLNIVKNNIEHSPGHPDPDEMFFLSQMPHIKALSPSDLLDFKCKFMDLLKSYTAFYN